MKRKQGKEIILIAVLFVAIFSMIIIRPIEDLDEIWNYNTARMIAEGKTPYRDISMITTPLLAMLNSIFLRGISNELMLMRVLAAALGTAVLYMIYRICKQTIKETNLSLIITALFAILFRDIYCIDYNFAALLLTLIIVYQELKQTSSKIGKRSKKTELFIGILAGMTIVTKQSIGGVIAIIAVIIPVFRIRNKEEIKEVAKEMGIRILGMAIPVILLLAYLLLKQSWNNFIDYAIKGISTFSNQISYQKLWESEQLEIAILSKIMPIALLILIGASILGKKEKEWSHNIQTMTCYSLATLIIMYPISDTIHFLIGGTLTILTTIYGISIIGEKIAKKIPGKKKKKIYKLATLLIYIILYAMIATKTASNLDTYQKQENKTAIKHYQGIQIEDYLIERINDIDSYISQQNSQGKTVYILDSEAAVYNIPLDIYHKNYDMFLKGNIGKGGEAGMIKEIQENDTKNNIYLIRKKGLKANWQTPKEVVNYVRNHAKKLEEVSIYEAMSF